MRACQGMNQCRIFLFCESLILPVSDSFEDVTVMTLGHSFEIYSVKARIKRPVIGASNQVR